MDTFASLFRAPGTRFSLGVLFLLASVFAFVRLTFVPLVLSTDGDTYMQTAQYLAGEGDATYPERLLKPLGPLSIALFATFFDHDYYFSFLVLNVLLYFLFGVVAWLFVRTFFRDDRAAFLGALLLISSYPVLKYGLDTYTDLGSWMLSVAALLGVIVYVQTPTRRNVVLTALVIVVGLLWKEYSLLAGATFGLVILTQQGLTARERLLHLGILGGIVMVVFGAAQYAVYTQFHFSYLDWYRIGARGTNAAISEHNLWFMGKSMFAVFLLGWIPALFGLRAFPSLSTPQRRILLCVAPPLFVAFLWGYVSSRLYFVFAPTLVLLAAHGLLTYIKSKRYQVITVLIIVFGNVAWLFWSDTFRHLL